jgi:type I restriction enzyme R subunit
LVRAYAALANDMGSGGYSAEEAVAIKDEVAHYVAVRDEVKLGAGENVDLKQFEAGMRALLDTYIQAEPSEKVATFKQGLVELIVERGAGALNTLPEGIKAKPEAVAETIINNVRSTIVDERAMNPKYYDKMSALLDALIEQRRQQALDYADYLKQLLDFAAQVGKGESTTKYSDWASTPARRALTDFGWTTVDVRYVSEYVQQHKDHDWATSRMKERALRRAVLQEFPDEFADNPKRLDDFIALLKEHDEYR